MVSRQIRDLDGKSHLRPYVILVVGFWEVSTLILPAILLQQEQAHFAQHSPHRRANSFGCIVVSSRLLLHAEDDVASSFVRTSCMLVQGS